MLLLVLLILLLLFILISVDFHYEPNIQVKQLKQSIFSIIKEYLKISSEILIVAIIAF